MLYLNLELYNYYVQHVHFQVADALDAICKAIPGGHILPDNFSEECSFLMCKYWDDMIELIVQDWPPEKICTAIKICP